MAHQSPNCHTPPPISDDFYGNPGSMYDFPPDVVICKCTNTCSQICKSYRNNVRSMLYHMHTAISELGLWGEFIKILPSKSSSIPFTNVKWIIDINSHPLVCGDSHSDDSFALSMQYMHFIATKGWDAFIKGWKKSKKTDNTAGCNNHSITVIVS
jgi:hypothetical protein